MNNIEGIERVINDIVYRCQINHLQWKKENRTFVKYNFDINLLYKVFIDIQDILRNLTYIPKMSAKKFLKLKLREKEYEEEFLEEIFARRIPIYIPHNQHNFLRNRKMNLRSIYEYAVLTMLDYDISHYPNLDVGKMEEEVKRFDKELVLFDIQACFENISGKDIYLHFMQYQVNKTIPTKTPISQIYALSVLNNENPMYMDSIVDKDLVRYFIDCYVNEYFEISKLKYDLDSYLLGVDEVCFITNKKDITGDFLFNLEKDFDNFIRQRIQLNLNKSKSKIINRDNFEQFKQDTFEGYIIYKNELIFQKQVWEYAELAPEEIFQRIKQKPDSFKYLIIQSYKDSILRVNLRGDNIKEAYNRVFKGIIYNDMQLFFEKIILQTNI